MAGEQRRQRRHRGYRQAGGGSGVVALTDVGSGFDSSRVQRRRMRAGRWGAAWCHEGRAVLMVNALIRPAYVARVAAHLVAEHGADLPGWTLVTCDTQTCEQAQRWAVESANHAIEAARAAEAVAQ